MASRWRVILTVIVVAVGAVPIAIGALVIASQANVEAAAVTRPYTPVAAQHPASPATPSLPAGTGSLVAVLSHATTMRSSPGGRALAQIGMRTTFGSPVAMWVVKHTAGWLGVVSPLAGNNNIGWVPRGAASLTRVNWRLEVTLSARRLDVLDGGRLIERYTVAIGAPYAPTPTGRFAVTDRLQTGDPTGPYGCCILALSAQAPHAIQGWNGGNRIAIHSTPETSSIGEAVSHGCLRLTLPEGRWLLAHIPLGTPTLIRS